MLGEPFMAEAAMEVGLVNRVVPPTECNAIAQSQARKLAAKPLSSLVETKRLMKLGQTAPGTCAHGRGGRKLWSHAERTRRTRSFHGIHGQKKA